METLYRANKLEARELSELAFRSKAHWPYPSKYLEDCKATIRMSEEYVEHSDVQVLKIGDKKIGFYAFCYEEGRPLLDHLWVEPAYIGTGMGKKLFQASVDRARTLGWESFKIISDPYALNFYLKMGATQQGQIESKYQKGLFLPVLKFQVQ